MKTIPRKSLLTALVAAPLFISTAVWGSDQTTQYYRVYSATNPNFWLDNTETGGYDWYMLNDWEVANTWSLWWSGTAGNGRPITVEVGTADNLLYLDSAERVGINKANPAEILEIATPQPGLRMDDTTAGEGYIDFEMLGHEFHIQGDNGQAFFFAETLAPTYSIYVDSDGDVGVAGATNPDRDLVVGGGGDVRLNDGASDHTLLWTSNGFSIYNNDGGTYRQGFVLGATAPSGSMVIETGTGDVGLGTYNPIAPLHVLRSNGTAQVRVEETNATAAKRTLYELVNNGEIRFTMRNTNAAVPAQNRNWDFLLGNDGFNISRIGSGGPEMVVRNDGGVRMGNKNAGGGGYDYTFELLPNGNATLDGTLTQGSDRNNKQDIVAVDDVSVLEKVSALPISTWEYKGQDGVKHLGPMAQDFHAAFGLGHTDKGLSSIDTGGVALAAIKGLNQVVQQKDAEIDDLKKRIALLEDMVMKIAADQTLGNSDATAAAVVK